MMKSMVLALSTVMLGGCVSTVASVVTAPVKVVAKGADWATTSRDEADRNRGRKIRKAEDRARKECQRQGEGDDARQRCIHEWMRNEGY
jgi:hypothetical protein